MGLFVCQHKYSHYSAHGSGHGPDYSQSEPPGQLSGLIGHSVPFQIWFVLLCVWGLSAAPLKHTAPSGHRPVWLSSEALSSLFLWSCVKAPGFLPLWKNILIDFVHSALSRPGSGFHGAPRHPPDSSHTQHSAQETHADLRTARETTQSIAVNNAASPLITTRSQTEGNVVTGCEGINKHHVFTVSGTRKKMTV